MGFLMRFIYCPFILTLSLLNEAVCTAFVRGIYVNQQSIHSTKKLQHLIEVAKSTDINTFVVDLHRLTETYKNNLKLIKKANINIHTRIIVFPGGGTEEQVHSDTYLEKRINLAKQAVRLGSKVIQLDYIRYSTKQRRSSKNAEDILKVINKFRQADIISGTPIHAAVFGEALYAESTAIGQNLRLFAPFLEGVAPMLYPSHFKPYKESTERAYETIYDSLSALKIQFNDTIPFEVIPYFEIYNIRVPMTKEVRYRYIRDQIRAIQDHQVNGWIAWSATNKYGYLFDILANFKQSSSK